MLKHAVESWGNRASRQNPADYLLNFYVSSLDIDTINGSWVICRKCALSFTQQQSEEELTYPANPSKRGYKWF
jgi:hypothetical protein